MPVEFGRRAAAIVGTLTPLRLARLSDFFDYLLGAHKFVFLVVPLHCLASETVRPLLEIRIDQEVYVLIELGLLLVLLPKLEDFLLQFKQMHPRLLVSNALFRPAVP